MPVATVVTAVWAMLPAYLPNNAAVLAGGGRPLDGGRRLNGRRLLGDGKTWRGTGAGVLAGIGVGLLLNRLATAVTEAVGVAVPTFSVSAIVGLAVGAVLGDIGASFLKRRLGRERGAAVPGLDQLDFVIGALIVTTVLAREWVQTVITREVFLAVLIVTPVLHVGTNVLAYGVGLKEEPW